MEQHIHIHIHQIDLTTVLLFKPLVMQYVMGLQVST